MHNKPFFINENAEQDSPVEAVLSFRPFINYLEHNIATDTSFKLPFYKYAYNQLMAQMESSHAATSAELQNSTEIMELLYATLSPIMMEENNHIWALGTPVPNKIIYSTDAFYKLINTENPSITAQDIKKDRRAFRKDQLTYFYKLILKRLYHFTNVIHTDFSHVYQDATTGLCTYYQIHVDDRFVDIEVTGTLPKLEFETLENYLHDENNLSTLMQLIPLHHFRLKGFSIITVSDVTFSQALQQIRQALISYKAEDAELYRQVIQSLQTLVGKNNIEFSLTPFVQLNGRHVINVNPYLQSVCVQSSAELPLDDAVLQSFFKEFKANPHHVLYPSIRKVKEDHHPFLPVLKRSGIQSFGVLPVFYQQQLTGIIEIHSRTELAVDEQVLSAVEVAVPLLAQLLQNSIESFNIKINTVILEKFTTLQPSVQWKFNEVAWEYLRSQSAGTANPAMGTVVFNNVYPLYGAVDIRNSTIEQNKALQQDVKNILHTINATLTQLLNCHPYPALATVLSRAGRWIAGTNSSEWAADETLLQQFVEQEVTPALLQYRNVFPERSMVVDDCLTYIGNGCSGQGHTSRRQLADDIQLINSAVTTCLNTARQQLQSIFPHYFETFRTDGVEYDIYVGQSIAPQLPFDNKIINKVCLWQIETMAQMACINYTLQHRLHTPLQTTQLIFIHGHAIDIVFRNDERRFDVEGTYNIRYEVIKKRIDKVMLKDKTERLTQPGTLAFVFLDAGELHRYENYIRHFQDEGLLAAGLEHLELDELQGIHGLKALRVGVQLLKDKKSIQAKWPATLSKTDRT